VARLLLWLVLVLATASPLTDPSLVQAEPTVPPGPLAAEWGVAIDPLQCPVARTGTPRASCLARVPADQEAIAPDGTWWRLRFADSAHAADWVARLLRSPGIRELEPAVRLSYQWMPGDPLVAQQDWLRVAGFPNAWDDTIGRVDVVVAVIDSGVAASHPDLAGKLLPGYDYLHRDSEPDDEVGHGTAVAGIIAAAADSQGITGGAPGVRLLPLKVGDQSGASSLLIAEAIYGAIERGAQVINLSLGADTPSATLERAIEQAYDQGIVVVAAAGNTPDAVTFPASYPEVIAVGGATADGKRLASFSSRLTRVDLIAPAENVLTTSWDGQEPDWEPRTGTSFAAPIVSAAAALVRSIAQTAASSGCVKHCARRHSHSTRPGNREPGAACSRPAGQSSAPCSAASPRPGNGPISRWRPGKRPVPGCGGPAPSRSGASRTPRRTPERARSPTSTRHGWN